MSQSTSDPDGRSTGLPDRNPQSGRAAFWDFASVSSPKGSFRIFRLLGISVYVNWTWFIVAYFQIRYRPLEYSTPIWKIAEYVALFAIVLLHEFGHALACRQVGGVANQIVLWPLGGVAYVSPPPRPGAHLWSIAAGPLVNLALIPVSIVGLLICFGKHGLVQPMSDIQTFVYTIAMLNAGLLVFNLLPIYPLDGGQIVRSLLWFLIGPARSLIVVTVIGSVLGSAVAVLALLGQRWWLLAVAVFVVMRSIGAFQYALKMARALKMTPREGFACPSCGIAPLQGKFWQCAGCRKPFDTFDFPLATCPNCGTVFGTTQCMNCRAQHPIDAWQNRVIVVQPDR